MNTLIRKAQHQDEESFVTLMESNAKDMYKIAYAILSNNEDVADAIHDFILLGKITYTQAGRIL